MNLPVDTLAQSDISNVPTVLKSVPHEGQNEGSPYQIEATSGRGSIRKSEFNSVGDREVTSPQFGGRHETQHETQDQNWQAPGDLHPTAAELYYHSQRVSSTD